MKTSTEQIVNGRKLKLHRLSKNLSIETLARQTSISRWSYSDYEKGRHLMSLTTFRQLCIALELDPLSVYELLYLPNINLRHLHLFRVACRRAGTTPQQALTDFLTTYIREQEKKGGECDNS